MDQLYNNNVVGSAAADVMGVKEGVTTMPALARIEDCLEIGAAVDVTDMDSTENLAVDDGNRKFFLIMTNYKLFVYIFVFVREYEYY